MRRRALAGAAAFAALLVAPAPAHAHLTSSGLGPFYDGLLHPLTTPEDLLPILALSLLAGLRGRSAGRAALFVLPAAWLLGSMGAMLLATAIALPALTAVLTIAIGALAALDRPLPVPAVASVAAALGLLHGVLNGGELAAARAGLLPVAGVTLVVFVVVSVVTGHVASLRAEWSRIAARVAGSWIAAVGLLMLGWSLRAR